MANALYAMRDFFADLRRLSHPGSTFTYENAHELSSKLAYIRRYIQSRFIRILFISTLSTLITALFNPTMAAIGLGFSLLSGICYLCLPPLLMWMSKKRLQNISEKKRSFEMQPMTKGECDPVDPTPLLADDATQKGKSTYDLRKDLSDKIEAEANKKSKKASKYLSHTANPLAQGYASSKYNQALIIEHMLSFAAIRARTTNSQLYDEICSEKEKRILKKIELLQILKTYFNAHRGTTLTYKATQKKKFDGEFQLNRQCKTLRDIIDRLCAQNKALNLYENPNGLNNYQFARRTLIALLVDIQSLNVQPSSQTARNENDKVHFHRYGSGLEDLSITMTVDAAYIDTRLDKLNRKLTGQSDFRARMG